MPTEYTLEIAGTEYPHVDLRYVRDYKFYGKLIEATIPEWVAAIAGDDAIVIKRDGATVTSGKIKKITPFENIDKGMGMVVTGYTKEMRHATLLTNARTYNADPHDIIIDDIGSSDLTDGTTNLYGSNIVVEFGSSDEAKFSRKAVYEEVAFITGWELYANPTGALDFKSQCGVDRSTTVAFKHGELLQNWFKPHMLNYLLKKTKVIVLGACEAEFEYYGIAGTGTDVYTIERKNLIDDNTCSLAAAAVYADMPNTLKVGVMDVIDTYVGAAYDVYDTVRVADSRFGLDENVRIYRIERRIDKDGEHTRIFYTNITKLTCNGSFLLDLAKGELAAGQRVLRDFARVRQSGSYLGAGATFPTTRLVTGDTFQLTADVPSTYLAWFYHYDGATPLWIRQQAQFRRVTNPTYGQLTGDINENTTDGKIYQWTGSEWEFIGTHEELGHTERKLPLYDPTSFHDYRTEEGINEWTEAITIKYPQYLKTVYRIKGVAILARRTTDATTGTLQVKAEVSWNEGVGWTQLGITMECETDVETEYTAVGDLAGIFDQPLWVKFSYRVYQEGAGNTDGYLRDCEAREHYGRTRWEDVLI